MNSNHLKIRHACTICGKDYSRKTNLTRHIQVEHNGVRYECLICGNTYTDRSSLKQHQDEVHKYIRYKCSCCGIEFKRKSRFNAHSCKQRQQSQQDQQQQDKQQHQQQEQQEEQLRPEIDHITFNVFEDDSELESLFQHEDQFEISTLNFEFSNNYYYQN